MAKNRENISEILRNHEERITALEQLIKNRKAPKIKNDAQSLSDHITDLRNDGFFSQPKTAEETHTKINVKYSCELNRVAVALVRLAGKKQLRISSKLLNKKKYKAYAW